MSELAPGYASPDSQNSEATRFEPGLQAALHASPARTPTCLPSPSHDGTNSQCSEATRFEPGLQVAPQVSPARTPTCVASPSHDSTDGQCSEATRFEPGLQAAPQVSPARTPTCVASPSHDSTDSQCSEATRSPPQVAFVKRIFVLQSNATMQLHYLCNVHKSGARKCTTMLCKYDQSNTAVAGSLCCAYACFAVCLRFCCCVEFDLAFTLIFFESC